MIDLKLVVNSQKLKKPKGDFIWDGNAEGKVFHVVNWARVQTEDGHLVTTVKSTQQKSSVQMELGINAEQNAMGKSVVTVKFELLPKVV